MAENVELVEIDETPVILQGDDESKKAVDATLPRRLVVDMTLMTIGDIAMLDEIRWERKEAQRKQRKAELPIGKFIDFLDRVVEGGVKDLPSSLFEKVTEIVMEQIEITTDRATDQGNSNGG